jgi:hypothetical protein
LLAQERQQKSEIVSKEGGKIFQELLERYGLLSIDTSWKNQTKGSALSLMFEM